MKKYRFPLATVLRVRRVEEERARAELLAANRTLTQADAELERRLGRYRSQLLPTGRLSHQQFLQARSRQDGAAASVVAAGEDRLRAEAAADQAQARWVAAATRVRALERLDERRREEHARAALGEEIAVLDEVAASRQAVVR